MDLRLEKADLLRNIGVEETRIDTFHFSEAPDGAVMEAAAAMADVGFAPANQAQRDAVRYIAEETDLLPVGMLIGPFSLMTKLLSDPIVPVAMAGMGLGPEEAREVLLVERALELAERAVARSLAAQIEAGAKAVIVCEPAANVVYISPKQLAAGSTVFERYVMEPNLRIRRQMAKSGVDLIFHNCGQLNSMMVQQFATRLQPSILSLGSSRILHQDAALVPNDIVLYGNLPTRMFYSDAKMPVEVVERFTRDLRERMRATGHPHILGSECDVLHVPDAAETIRRKVQAMLTCS
ncbi:MAG: hypothetical protein GY953_11695 [bacterium]|nr:hypothetical protein [bacterium]